MPSGFEPKEFQLAALDALRIFLSDARLRMDPGVAFLRATNQLYRPLPGLEAVPSVCLRLPTGGGKTLLAGMSIAVAADTYLQRELPLVLWLVPTDAIRRQTLRALSDPDHPYRQALAVRYGSAVLVREVSSFAMLTPQDVATHCTVLIGTMQSLQVTNTEGRRVYAHNENLEAFFKTAAARAMPGLEQDDNGRPKFSFANVLKLHTPLVILDEAHRFITPLAREVRQRIGPGAVVEFTATPVADEANVLHRATAGQLKDEGMIKLPVLLTEHQSHWEQAVAGAVRERRHLAELAANEPRYIRPILLIQAQNADETATWEVVHQHLLTTEGLLSEEIAVVTGSKDDLRDADLLSAACPVTTVITVQALAEGWDCPFAYVLCSVATLRSEQAVEQMIGRVLRMPGATPCVQGELNKAYVHASSREFGDTARALRDGLVKNGFEQIEAQEAVKIQELPLFTELPAFRVTLPTAPDLSDLSADEAAAIEVQPTAFGTAEVFVRGAIPQILRDQVARAMPVEQRAAIERRMDEHDRQHLPSPAERGVRFAVPRLAVEIDGEWLPFDRDVLEEQSGTDLLRHPFDASLFCYDETTRIYSFDLLGEVLQVSHVAAAGRQPVLLQSEWTAVSLVRWLANRLRDVSVTDAALTAWVDNAVQRLLQRPEVDLAVLDAGRYILERLLAAAKQMALAAERKFAYQELLFSHDAHASALPEFAFRFGPEYPATFFCERTVFPKHFYYRPGELKESGEEYECAVEIDRWEETEVWVRNLSRRERTSFALQTSTDLFYPDFVVKLKDGRVLALEYKGADRADTPDTQEKDRLGRLWADRSGGLALFAVITRTPTGKPLRRQLQDALLGSSIFARQ